MSSRKIDGEPYVLDIMQHIAKERKRLEGIVASPEYKENLRYRGWMEDWLKKTDEEHYKNLYDGECNVCGKKARYFLCMDFSFCDEHGCGIKICSKCLTKMKSIFKNGVKALNCSL